MNLVWRVELIHIRLMFLLTEIYKKYIKFIYLYNLNNNVCVTYIAKH